MLFHISRTSIYSDDETFPPCDGAFRKECLSRDERTVGDPEELPDKEDWFKRGTGHTVINGHVVRFFPRKRWFVEIDDLMEFSRKYGDIIINTDGSRDTRGYPQVEIYDDYRE